MKRLKEICVCESYRMHDIPSSRKSLAHAESMDRLNENIIDFLNKNTDVRYARIGVDEGPITAPKESSYMMCRFKDGVIDYSANKEFTNPSGNYVETKERLPLSWYNISMKLFSENPEELSDVIKKYPIWEEIKALGCSERCYSEKATPLTIGDVDSLAYIYSPSELAQIHLLITNGDSLGKAFFQEADFTGFDEEKRAIFCRDAIKNFTRRFLEKYSVLVKKSEEVHSIS